MGKNKSLLKLNCSQGGIAFAVFMVLYVFALFLMQTVAGAIFGAYTTKYILACSIVSPLCFLAVILWFILTKKLSFRVNVNLTKSGGAFLPVSIILSAGMFLGLGFVNYAFSEILATIGITPQKPEFPLNSIAKLIVFSITFALLPAILEEMFFRGVLLNSLSKQKPIVAVLVQALCFAVYHCNLSQFLYQFIYGVALGLLAINCKSTLPCIIAHFINNFVVILLEYLKVTSNFLFSPITLVIGINLLAIFFTIMYFALKRKKKGQAESDQNVEEVDEKEQNNTSKLFSFFVPFGIFAIAICVMMMVLSVA